MPLTGFCKWVFLIFPALHSAPNPPMSQCFSIPPCSSGLFPCLHFISTTFSIALSPSPCLPCLPLFPLDWTRTSPILMTPGTLSCLQPFHRNEQIWWSIVSPLCTVLTHSHMHQTATKHRTAQRSRLPANYHSTSPTPPPVPTPTPAPPYFNPFTSASFSPFRRLSFYQHTTLYAKLLHLLHQSSKRFLTCLWSAFFVFFPHLVVCCYF